MAVNRKALRQREWVIYIRPYYVKGANNSRVYYTGDPKVGNVTDMGNTGQDTAVAIKGVGEGMELGTKMEYDKGTWVLWYKSNSFQKTKEKYREILALAGADYVRVVENLPVDVLITPNS